MAWQKDMHKFQRGYLIGLLGGSYEDIPEVYKERSAINHADDIDTPLLVSLIHVLVVKIRASRLTVDCVAPTRNGRCGRSAVPI